MYHFTVLTKEFFNKTLDSDNNESRNDHIYLNTDKRENYLFNSSINGIENSDFIFLIGSNPRYEATILNARIRKAYLQNRMDPYQRLGYIGDACSGTPSGQMAMTMGTSPVSNPLSQALGAGLGIMGLGSAGSYMT